MGVTLDNVSSLKILNPGFQARHMGPGVTIAVCYWLGNVKMSFPSAKIPE